MDSEFEKQAVGPPASALFDLGFYTGGNATPAPPSTQEKAGDLIGRYRLLGSLGEGGFGCVWHVEQTDPIHRELALKLIKPGMDSREIIARFEAERQALALMDHPNIAVVLDAGTTASVRPYFVMELVKGEPITDYCDRHQLGIRERLELFIPVCQAVQHAHQKAILHRDLKPSNILVATVDGKPVPKVIDFGIAKALDTAAGDEPETRMLRTQQGVIIGTPRYMSPEQAGSVPDVDTRSDVYSLGVVLCELLTGQCPFPGQPADAVEALRWVREAEPVKPSTLVQHLTPAVAAAAVRRGMDTTRFARSLRGDLDWIILKALEKNRARRYETATALARDLERHLAQEPVTAAAPTWRYKMGKFARRQRGVLVAASLVVSALVAGLIASLSQAARAERHRVEAEGHRMEAEANYARAREAVEQYLSRVTGHPRLKEADFMDLQRELLETAVPFYEKMAHYQGTDPKLSVDRAWALVRLARLYRDTGSYEKAEAAFLEAIKAQEALRTLFPDDPVHQMELGYQHNELAYIKHLRGNQSGSRSSYDIAVRLEEDLMRRFPDKHRYQHALSTVVGNRGMILLVQKDYTQAYDDFTRSGRILIDLVKEDPKTTAYLHTLGNVLNSFGTLHDETNRLDLAFSGYRQAVESHERAVSSDPHNRDYRQSLGASLINLGSVLEKQGKDKEAEVELRRAVDLLQRIVDEFPTVPSYRRRCIEACDLLSRHLLRRKQANEADAVLDRLRVNQERLAADSPSKSQHAEALAGTHLLQADSAFDRKDWTIARDRYLSVVKARPKASHPHMRLCRVALATKDHLNAVKHGVEFARLDADPGWQNQELAASLLLEAVPLIQADGKLDTARREKLLDECASQVTALLKTAMERGYVGLSHFRSQPQVEALRDRPDFKTMLNTLCAPPDHAPSEFQFNYKFDNPGPRVWTREGLIWTEMEPGGVTNVFTIAGPAKVNGIAGTELRKVGEKKLTVFVPDLGTQPPLRLMMRGDDGSWTMITTITEME
ncbi:MAG TPA: protein kinase [Prosthecobacter sp.]